MGKKLAQLWIDCLYWLATRLDDLSYWLYQRALYNRWTTCKYCHIENGYGHKDWCPKAKKVVE